MGKSTIHLIACSALSVLAGAAHAQAARESLTIRASQPLPSSVQTVLSELATTTERKVPPGTDPFDTLRSHCGGSFTNDFYEQVRSLNSNFLFKQSDQARVISLPACPRLLKNTTATVMPGEDIAALIRRTLGVRPTDVVSVCDASSRSQRQSSKCQLPAQEAIASLNGGKRAGLEDLRVGRVLSVPTYSQATTIALKPGIEASDAIAQIQAAAENAAAVQNAPAKAIVAIHPPAHLQLIPLLGTDDASLAGTACASTAPAPVDWPFNRTRLQQTIEFSRAAALSSQVGLTPTIIRVADTGALGLDTFFPKTALALNMRDAPNQNQDLDKNGFTGDRYGINPDLAGQIEPFDDDPFKLHGTQVADIALGGSAFRLAYPKLSELLNLSFAKIFWKGTGAIAVNDGILISSMRAIQNHHMPSVINFSVGASNENNTRYFVTALANAEQLNFLAVIAAGNDGQDIGVELMYPAAYGGLSSPQAWIVSVGASDPSGNRAQFSNYSRNRVDILAPGCRIPFTAPDGSTALLSGTSVAAPLVSFAAGLVHALGVSSMADVKMRLIASADYNPTLADETRFGGVVLNIERAVSLYQDSLRLPKEAADHRGKWKRPAGGLAACRNASDFNPAWIVSIWGFDAEDVRRLRIIAREADGQVGSPLECEASDGGIDFVDADGTDRHVKWTELTALIPAFPFPPILP